MTSNEVISETVVAVQAASTTVEVIEKLTEEEAADRQQLELKVEKVFYEAGKSLPQLRHRPLYRSTYKNFETFSGRVRESDLNNQTAIDRLPALPLHLYNSIEEQNRTGIPKGSVSGMPTEVQLATGDALQLCISPYGHRVSGPVVPIQI